MIQPTASSITASDRSTLPMYPGSILLRLSYATGFNGEDYGINPFDVAPLLKCWAESTQQIPEGLEDSLDLRGMTVGEYVAELLATARRMA